MLKICSFCALFCCYSFTDGFLSKSNVTDDMATYVSISTFFSIWCTTRLQRVNLNI